MRPSSADPGRNLPRTPRTRRLPRARLTAAACLAATALSGPAPADAARYELGAPGLEPRFSARGHDYVVPGPCLPAKLHVEVSRRTTISVNGSTLGRGERTIRVPLAAGESARVAARGGGLDRVDVVRCLPRRFPRFELDRRRRGRRPFYAVTPNKLTTETIGYAVVFDRRGAPVWWFGNRASPRDARLLADGRIAWARRFDPPGRPYAFRRLDGKLLRVARTAGSVTDPHDMSELANGNLLLQTYRPRSGVDLSPFGGPADATVLDAEIQEIDPAGKVVWKWNSRGRIDEAETGRWYGEIISDHRGPPEKPRYDTVHMNSIEPSGGSIVISARHTDAVYSIDRASGEVEWKLGGRPTPERLEVRRDPRAPRIFGGQHDARVLADGTLTVFDNASDRDRRPRAVRYRINPEAGTARLLEQIKDPLAHRSSCCGSARRAPDGSWVIAWGRPGLISEFDASGRRTFTLRFGAGRESYRVAPAGRAIVSRRQLRTGMDAMHPSFPYECRLPASARRIDGGDGDERLDGGPRSDGVLARAGADQVISRGAADCVLGGPGEDRIGAGPGADRAFGGPGDDRVRGNAGDDRLGGGPGADLIDGGRGDDRIAAGSGDTVRCGSGFDIVFVDGDPRSVAGSCESVR